ncbi:MAG: TrkA C-terminal domain-containing protein [Candidatus Limnocylindrales bacterium]
MIAADDPLDDALGRLADGGRAWAPVVADGRLAGIVSTHDILSAYRRALAANVRQVRSVGSTGSLVEADVGAASVLAGRPVAKSAWPRETVLVSIGRGDRLIVPRGDVVLEAGDRLTIFSAPSARPALETLLGTAAALEPAPAPVSAAAGPPPSAPVVAPAPSPAAGPPAQGPG